MTGPEVSIVEVGPRDGLQNFERDIPTSAKVAFIDALVAAGLRTVETTSFVNPAAVPKMADASEVMAGIARQPGVRYLTLVPNIRGLQRALDAGVDSIALFAAATEEFSRANLNASIEETYERFRAVVAMAAEPSLWIRGYISVAFHCPYSGNVSPEQVLSVIDKLRELGCDEIALADTTGQADSESVTTLVGVAANVVPVDRLALHFHDTRGRAIENIAAGYELGVRVFDGSAGGIGGCPFSPGAPGNVATEQVVRYFEQRGISTGIDGDAVRDAYEQHVAHAG